ncbi:MAG: gamma-glutamyl-gamma-aminobutyrate hydrolase family protein [Ignavibacteria bacterium]|nr:gamma-glutamyl-gamma-aminobutyrate hydrolase family protein [Ignavibacteria bacterium]
MKIGVTKTESKIDFYLEWLRKYNIDFTVLDFENGSKEYDRLRECSGLMLTGGIDIYPELFCDWDTKERKGTYQPGRDGFELNLLDSALNSKMPVLAICRGLQLVNVYFRGSLIFDIEETRKVNHRKISKNEDRIHRVNIFKDTLLYKITGVESCDVNSSHHQSVDRLGEGLMINAKTDDGIIEGIEFSDKKGKSFLIGVQWHPERFKNLKEPASENILKSFLSEAEKYN